MQHPVAVERVMSASGVCTWFSVLRIAVDVGQDRTLDHLQIKGVHLLMLGRPRPAGAGMVAGLQGSRQWATSRSICMTCLLALDEPSLFGLFTQVTSATAFPAAASRCFRRGVHMSQQAVFEGAGPVRAGHELPLDRLTNWLRRHAPYTRSRYAVEVRQFNGGQSNPTYRLDTPSGPMSCAASRAEPCGAPMRSSANTR